MNTLGLWRWLIAAVVLFGLIVPAVLAVWMIWLRPVARAPMPELADEPDPEAAIALRDGR